MLANQLEAMEEFPFSMSAKVNVISLSIIKPIKIFKWKVKEGTIVSVGRIILLYDFSPHGEPKGQLKLKATKVGTVRKLLAKEGDIVYPGESLLELEPCTHPTVMKDMCAECGADLRREDSSILNASVPMVHSIPELKVSQEEAQILGRADEERLLADRKLVLLVDLDQTLIHTTNDNIPANLKDVYHFQLYGPTSPWYHTRLRPGTQKFLEEISLYYELHICTFGARNYAHMIAMFLDHDGKYFSHRILSRDECFNATSKTANLRALFPCGDNMVCIIDDREDVWNFVPNMIHVKPYHFFKHTGDINAPPGLSKRENDDKEGFDFTELDHMKKVSSKSSSSSSTESNSNDGCDGEKVVNNGIKDKSELGKKLEDSDVNNSVSEDPFVGETLEDCTEGLITQRLITPPPVTQLEDTKPSDTPVNDKKEEPENKNTNSAIEEGDNSANNIEKECDNSTNNIENKGDKTTNNIEKEGDKSTNNIEKEGDNSTNNVDKEGDNSTNNVNKEGDDKSHVKAVETSSEKKKDNDDSETITDKNKEESDNKPVEKTELKEDEEELIEVEDEDDYLLYLVEILKNIHLEFYKLYDKTKKLPDLKAVIPEVRSKVLCGTSLVFSGLVPTNTPLEKSQPYKVAVSLGAKVTQEITPSTTHVVAVRPGTAKVNTARRAKGVHLVTSNWLWACAERWERVDERLYHLVRGGVGNRHPPPHCGSPEHIPTHSNPATIRFRTPSGRFMDTINPLMSFSPEDIAKMDQEVEDIFDESESEGDIPLLKKRKHVEEESEESSSSSVDSLAGEHPHGWGNKSSRKREAQGTGTESDLEEEDETPSAKFRRGEPLPSDLDFGDEDSIGSDDPPDEVDDGEWNMMGAQLEREFLSGNGNDD